MKKQNLMPVIVLTVICLVAALLMGFVNMISAPEIEKAKNEAANAALNLVLPNGKDFAEIDIDTDFPKEITKAYRADGGYVFEATVSGNKPGMVVMCGVDSDGKIVGVEVISNDETPSYWEKVYSIVTGTDGRYSGKSTSDLTPELISGATKSSTAVYNAVKASLNAYAVITGGEVTEEPDDDTDLIPPDITTPVIDRTEEEMKALVYGMYPDGAELEDVFVYQPDPTTVKVWKNTVDNTYALYLATRTQYTPLETEAIFIVNEKGTVLDLVPLTWSVGHGVDYTIEYINSFIGKNKYSANEVELVTEATVTSQNLVSALESALRDVFGSVPMTDEEIERFAMKAAPDGEKLEKLTLSENAPETVKAMFKLTSGRGYVFYTVTSTQYVKYETEAFIYTDINGKIMDLVLATWTVGHGVEASDDFINGFVGKTFDTIETAELVTGATATSENLRDAVKSALSLVPEHVNYSVIAVIILAVFIGGAVAYTATKAIIRRKQR